MTSDKSAAVDRRALLLSAIKTRNYRDASGLAAKMLASDNSIRTWRVIAGMVRDIPDDAGDVQVLKVALLSSFSIELVHDALIARAFSEGFRLEIYQAGFNQFRQEVLDPGSGLYTFDADVVIVAVDGSSWAPGLYDGFLDLDDAEYEQLVAGTADSVLSLASRYRERSTSPVLFHNLDYPLNKALGIGDGCSGAGQTSLVNDVNGRVKSVLREVGSCYVVDYAGLVHRAGAGNWYDLRMAYLAKAPVNQQMIGLLAGEYVKYFRAFTGKNKKCLVLDLDNTLWGGVLGEDGFEGIRIGAEYPGSAYAAFQKAVLGLYKRGVILAVASKNNEADVRHVFENHKGMVLRPGHFSSIFVNWDPKSESIRKISEELNIQLEHMVFADDNPAECSLIQQLLPEVTTINLTGGPETFVGALLEDGLFDTLNRTAEDTRRAGLYRQRSQSESLRKQFDNLEDFYRSLEMRLYLSIITPGSLQRSAQLTQKTNQFNTTTIRMTEADIQRASEDRDWEIFTVRVEDCFGDNGIVGLAMARVVGETLEIETFLLSCRVIGRTIETAMLSELQKQARSRGLRYLSGRIVPTAKNQPVRDLYAQHGFSRLDGGSDGESGWILECGADSIQVPDWITVIYE